MSRTSMRVEANHRVASRWVCGAAILAMAVAPLTFAAAKADKKAAKTPAEQVTADTLPQNPEPQAADDLATLPGFKVESILKAEPSVQGSWINLAKDAKGRLYLGGQKMQKMTRVTVENGRVVKQEILKLPVSETMGILFAFDHLYVDGWGKNNEGKTVFGLFRCKSTKDDDTFDQVEFLREWQGGSGEHGAHAIVQGPDKKLYIVTGNFVTPPADLLPSSPHRNYADDLVLPRAEDGNGFGAGKKPPGGMIIRMDPDGKNAELYASGQRNTYDIAFNADGELFGFDSDMEWDWGMPWYRPIRVFHATSGADMGFREGTAKWPTYYYDSLPPAVNIGIGCPTGVAFGYGAKFPAKYQKAFYILDWTYGRLIAAHLTPKGSSYEATWENFVAPKALHEEKKTPLNLTDVVIGNDGAMYFTIGGRGTAAQLFRVSYTGKESTESANVHDSVGESDRALRHKIEAFHGHQDKTAVDAVWPSLSNADRFLRYSARIAIESQPVEEWKAKALSEKNPEAALTSLLALARLGGTEAQADLFKAMAKFPVASLTPEQQMEKIRLYQVAIARQGKPSAELAKQIIDELNPLYPADSDVNKNRELCKLLLALDAPNAVAKTVKLLEAAPTQEEQISYVLALRTIKDGWTADEHKAYFQWFVRNFKEGKHPDFVTQWFTDAGRDFDNGASFPKFVERFHNDAMDHTLTAGERTELASLTDAFNPPAGKPRKPAKVRPLVKEWQMADLEPLLDEVGHGRNFQRGKTAFDEAQCIACHRFGSDGGSVGPDLTAVASRFKRHDILESIILPSKVISEQYMNQIVRTKGGDVIEGRVLEETDTKLVMQPNPLKPDKVTVEKSEVKSRGPSKVSPMPEGLVNTFTKEEIFDLIAYMESAGKKDHPDFKK